MSIDTTIQDSRWSPSVDTSLAALLKALEPFLDDFTDCGCGTEDHPASERPCRFCKLKTALERARAVNSSTARFVKRNYWDENGSQCSYRCVWHDHYDERVDRRGEIERLIRHVADGEEFEVTIRATGKKPFGERLYRYQRPHVYEPETDEQMAARLESDTK